MRVSAAFLSFSWVAVAGCTPEADYPSDVIVESEHFVYQARAGAPFCPASVAAIEDHFAASQAQLGFAWPTGRRITYYLYRDQTDFAKNAPCPGTVGCTRVDSRPEIHALLPVDRHELVHAYLAHIGFPHPIYAEGIAGLLYCDSAAEPIYSYSADWRKQLFLTTNGEFVAYDQASTLVRYLVTKNGPAKFLAAYAQSRHDVNPDTFAEEFSRLFGESIDQVWLAASAAIPRDGVVRLCPCDAPPAPTDGSELANQACAEAPDEYRPVVFRLDDPSLVLLDTLTESPQNQIRACRGSALASDDSLPLAVGGARTITVSSLSAGQYFLTRVDRPRIQARPSLSACADNPPFPLEPTDYSLIAFGAAKEPPLIVPLRFSNSYRVITTSESIQMCDSCPESNGAACISAATAASQGQALSGDLVLVVAAGAGPASMTLMPAP
ncbi:MAG TPA: hypothetical protein VJ860_04400 [Polyangia bacterium]|nr:hypothetical protein [Polyangia bacterium]